VGCCNNKNKTSCQIENLSVAELGGYGTWLLNSLIDVVKSGRVPLDLKNETAQQLAAAIANLIDENNYLKAVLRVFTPEIVAQSEQVTIKFGPSGQYALHLPIASEGDRERMIAELLAAVEELKKSAAPPHPAQQLLFDRSAAV